MKDKKPLVKIFWIIISVVVIISMVIWTVGMAFI